MKSHDGATDKLSLRPVVLPASWFVIVHDNEVSRIVGPKTFIVSVTHELIGKGIILPIVIDVLNCESVTGDVQLRQLSSTVKAVSVSQLASYLL